MLRWFKNVWAWIRDMIAPNYGNCHACGMPWAGKKPAARWTCPECGAHIWPATRDAALPRWDREAAKKLPD